MSIKEENSNIAFIIPDNTKQPIKITNPVRPIDAELLKKLFLYYKDSFYPEDLELLFRIINITPTLSLKTLLSFSEKEIKNFEFFPSEKEIDFKTPLEKELYEQEKELAKQYLKLIEKDKEEKNDKNKMSSNT